MPDRLAQVDSGDGQVQGGLLLGSQPELGQIVGVGIDAVAELVLAADGDDQHRHPLVPQEPLVPLEGLAPGPVGGGIARHPVGDLPQAERARRVEQHQQEVGDPFEPVEACHQGQSRGRNQRGRP